MVWQVILALLIYDLGKAGIKAVVEIIKLGGYIEGADKAHKLDNKGE